MNGFLLEREDTRVACRAIRNSFRRAGRVSLRPLIGQVLVATVVATAVSLWHTGKLDSQVRAEPRRITAQEPDQHFKSGGRLSETVLQEILVVLKRMDERMERIEKAAEQIVASSRGPVAPLGDDTRLSDPSSQIQVRRSR